MNGEFGIISSTRVFFGVTVNSILVDAADRQWQDGDIDTVAVYSEVIIFVYGRRANIRNE